jgi:general secretion pathway protein D
MGSGQMQKTNRVKPVFLSICFGVWLSLGLASCETTGSPLDQESARSNPFGRVFPDQNRQQETVDRNPTETDETDTSSSTEAKIYPATGPRAGKAIYQAGKSAGGGFNVNFSEADLQEVVQTILGDLLDQPFILDPRVQGKVTAATGGPVTRDGLLSLLETVLSMNSAAMVRSGSSWRIAPAGEVYAGGQTRFTGAGRPGFGITLIPLKHISATNMIALLENSVTRAGTVKPDLVRNMLLVSGNGTERSNALAAVRAFDVDWMNGMATGIFPLRNASAGDIIAELEILLQTLPGGGMEGAIRLQAIERINGILVVAASNEMLAKAKMWIERLDMGGPSDVSLRTYKIDNGKALETADLLNQLFGGASVSRSSSVSPDLNQTSNSSARIRRSTPTTSSSSASLGNSKSGAPRIIGDPINNTLVVLANPQGQQLVAQALREIDHPPAQVLIDMVIAEVTLNDTLRYGVQYFFTTNGLGNIADSGRGGFSTGSGLDANGVFPGFNFILDQGTDARFALDILDSITDLKIVSSPHIVAIDNQKAHLQVGDQVPVITRQTQDVVNANAPQVNSVEFRDTGVILDVTPRISSTGLVTMEIRQEVSNVSTTASTGQLTPTISKRLLESTVAARSGQTVLLGGLISDEQQNSTTGLPGLSKTPFIKDLFGGHNITSKRTELIVFLTPRVLNVDKDMSKLVDEIRQRMVLIGREADKAAAEDLP